jgi:hypothetical protein
VVTEELSCRRAAWESSQTGQMDVTGGLGAGAGRGGGGASHSIQWNPEQPLRKGGRFFSILSTNI